MFTPSATTTGQEVEPRLDLLSDARTTHVVYNRSDHNMVHDGDWLTADPSHRPPDNWTSGTIFELATTTPTAATFPLRELQSLNCRCIWNATTGKSRALHVRGTTTNSDTTTATRRTTQPEGQTPTIWKTSGLPSSTTRTVTPNATSRIRGRTT